MPCATRKEEVLAAFVALGGRLVDSSPITGEPRRSWATSPRSLPCARGREAQSCEERFVMTERQVSGQRGETPRSPMCRKLPMTSAEHEFRAATMVEHPQV